MEKVFWEDKTELVFNKYRPVTRTEIAPGIMSYENVIPKEVFDTFVVDLEEGIDSAKIEWGAAKVKTGVGDKVETAVDTESRDTQTINIPYSQTEKNDYSSIVSTFYTSMANLFLENLIPLEVNYQNNYSVTYSWHDSYQILKYGVGQKFTNHIDDHPDYHRRISTLYYLNDNYSGGELNFPRFNLSFKPKANQMIIFPSTYVYNHSVSPVTEGERYAVVSWMR
jgi:predicted 2-oxoglutarate/Fe(II)-dependent dioxygenase YbiX